VGSFEEFYEREFATQVRRAFLLIRSNETANDVVHDAMLGVYKRWGAIENPAGYLNRSVINGCRDAARRSRSRRALISRIRPVAKESGQGEILDDILASLPFNHRAAVVLRFYGGWTAEEIADALDCSPNSIGPWISRALTTMEKELS
jgi:RNA polymerase sigma factor (sigma-70 family)